MNHIYQLVDIRHKQVYQEFLSIVFPHVSYFKFKPLQQSGFYLFSKLYDFAILNTDYLFYATSQSYKLLYASNENLFLSSLVEFYDESNQLIYYHNGLPLTSRLSKKYCRLFREDIIVDISSKE